MRKKNQPDLAYMSLGLASQYDLNNKIDKVIPVNDPKNRVFKAMVNKGICGISALASLGDSTTEWNRHIIAMLDKIPVLVRIENPMVIIGESGTGKESMAKVLHSIANGDDKPFKPVNCSAIPGTMLEAELFGYKKGAFTDAREDRKGLIESAKKGSLFLDELGKMDFNLQYKLLRVIEEHKVRRLGSNEDILIDDVKFIISLQPKDIEETEEKTIAVDLLNRLNLYSAIELPQLKERLKADPKIIHDVLAKLQKGMDLMDESEKRKLDALKEQVTEAYKKFEKSHKKIHMKIIKQARERDDGLVEAALAYPLISKEGKSDLDDTILPDQLMKTKKNDKLWNEYIQHATEIFKLESQITLSWDAEQAILAYDGYTGINFRDLENILKYAILRAHIAKRKEILLEDLPEKVRNPKVKEETQESMLDESISIPLKDIIDYANEKKKSIVKNKISSIRKNGLTIKGTLKLEGVRGKSDYISFYKKVERILGKAFVRGIGD